MSKLLLADITNERLRRSLGGAEFAFPVLAQKSTLTLGLRFSEQLGIRHVEIYPTVHEIRATIGPVDEQPVAGQFSLKVGGGSPVVGTNLTTLLNYNVTAAEMQAAIRVLTGLSAATVEEDEDSFLVRGVASTISVFNNTLRPISFVRVLAYEVDGSTTQAIRLQRAPYAFTDVYDQRVPSPPVVTRVGAGSLDPDLPEIQKLTVPLDFQNSYRLRRTSPTLKKSALLGVADGPDEIAAAINPNADGLGLSDDVDGVFIVEEHPTDPASLISFTGSMLGGGYDLLEVEVFDPKPGDYWLHLNLDTAMLAEAFRAAGVHKLMRVPIEIFADIEGDDEETRTVTVYQGEVTIRESVTHGDLATAQNIDWINPPTAKQFAPVSPDSLTEGARFWPFLLGNGSDIEFQKTHSLNSPRIRVNLRENITEGRELVHGTDFEYVHDDNDAVTITLLGTYASSPPALNALTGTVQDLTLTSTWLGHNQPINTITGLQAILDAHGAAIAELQARIGIGGDVTLAAPSVGGDITRPLPSVWRIPRTRPANMPEDPGTLIGWNPFAEGSLLRDIRLLPAVHLAVANVESLPATLPAPSATYRDRVFYSSIARPDFPGGELPLGAYAACDGRDWYRVARESDSESTWYPTLFSFELFRLSVSPDELALRKTLDLAVGLEAALFTPQRRPDERRTVGRYSLILERGVRLADASPGTPGSNIDTHFSSPVILAQHDFDLTEVPCYKRIGLSINRSSGGVLTATATKFATPISVSPPASADFVLRLRLARPDFEDLPLDGRGIPAFRGLNVGLDGKIDTTLGQLVIS